MGDTHLKQKIILPRVDAAIDQYDIDRVVFLGDYCDEWYSNDSLALAALEYLADWAEDIKESSHVVCEFVLGNHDMQYLLGTKGPGMHLSLIHEVRELLESLNLVAATTVDDFLITHAGLTQEWADLYLDDAESAESVKKELNALFESEIPENWHDLLACGSGRGGFDSPGPLWADKNELWEDAVVGIKQIVGHTPVADCYQLETMDSLLTEGLEEIWLCDTFSLSSDLYPIGDGSMLLLSDGEVSVVGQGFALGIDSWEEDVHDWGLSMR